MKRAFLLATALLSSPALADGIVDNVNGLAPTADGRVIRFKAVLIDAGGKVTRLVPPGEEPPKLSRRELKKNAGKPLYDWRIDMGGKTLLPGFIDAHGHVMGLGFGALSLDLSGARSLNEAKAMVAAYIRANPDRKWTTGRGWNQEAWGLGRFPTAADLDDVAPGHSVWLERADGHAGWANSKAMREAGVTTATASPPGGRIEKAGAAPAGVFVDAAMQLVERAVPKPLAKERDAAFLEAQQKLLANGITAVADMGTTVDDWLSYRRMADLGALRVRIMSYAAGVETASQIGGKGPTPWLYNDRLRMGGVKIYLDGALGSRGAVLKAPYADAPGERGLSFLNDTQLQNQMSRAAMDDFQLAVHAIGDKANAQVLDAIQVLSETYTGDRRWRIEHAQVIDPADLKSFGKFGTIASMQPTHQTGDRTMAEARLGPARLAGAYAWKSVLANGGKLALGSDFPVEKPDPWDGWAAAFTRQDAQGQPPGGWRPEEAVTREQAWWAFTGGAAYAGFAEQKFGNLAPGQKADFIIVDRDPLTADPMALRTIRVEQTWIGGEKAFDRAGGAKTPAR
ncbi:amidohydrolase [Sphingomonas mucosissima]|uniref:N-substituted formamide deformylase n=1 Tax=Sphingomonas mucosissima TaxID=370959 RepID=A0A245ZQG0_9SPHN|nr:amidohydrolase [Sphingomonas mucosissima]OWK31969.1 N-substituted formamide deformylase precursor [Sphingomonas mucosissima]